MDAKTILSVLIQTLLTLFPKEMLKGFIDAGLDKVENMIDSTETQFDDALLEPLVNKIREVLDVPDND
jgi:hypothetical protein